MKLILILLIVLIVLAGCNVDSSPYQPAPTLTFDEKVKQGKNTGTQADIYNQNPYSVFDTYSPWNQFQN